MIAVDPARVRRILVRANNWIGDVVMISPAVRAIRERFPGARISILAKSRVTEALHGSPFYDDLIEYADRGVHRGSGRWRLIAELRARRFDLAVLFQKAFEAAAFAYLAGARLRIGYATDCRSALLTHALPQPPPGTHHVDQFLGLARALGCDIRDPIPAFHLDEEARWRATRALGRAAVEDGRPLVALHPGASKTPRAWHAERFAELGRRLAARREARVVLIGSRSESDLLARAAAAVPPDRIVTPPPDLSIRVIGAILERCRLFVGNDSGPMHVAAALGVPTVGIFGPGSPARTAPRARPGRLAVVSKVYPCSPCRQDFFRECPDGPSGKPFCLEEIGVDEVEGAALDLWHRTAAPAP